MTQIERNVELASIPARKSAPWALLLVVGMAVAKWGFHVAIPLWLVWLPLYLPVAILFLISGCVLGCGAFCGLAYLIIRALEVRHKRSLARNDRRAAKIRTPQRRRAF